MQSNSELLRSLPRDTRLADRTAVVTGSSSGIGEAVARVLAASGAEVVITGRDTARVQAVAEAVRADGGAAHAVTADLGASPEAVRAFAREATAALGGRVDVMVNNAGVYPVAPTAATSDADLEAVWATNIRAPHVLVAALAPAMAERGSGSIVTVGSWMARTGVPFGAVYAASRAAVEQFTRTWAAEYGPSGVRVNTVAPGATATPGNAGSEAVLAAMTSTTPAGQPVRPVDIATAVRWLVTDEAAFVHGALLDVDGGLSATRFLGAA
ncbi:SDR family NAD(P)-dependent oxidoreductase [uncultured Pseudokineococcus sp.]|uniref:SDR family NAD(P)-dependent oxidoreductase n=1 Tax=uncultured Pseudokineococcus sp. TaxID=1642928 RepID=UPI002618D0C5|nr:SDR family oxidoreductase [uncultured Pseudokineococcus sp.]